MISNEQFTTLVRAMNKLNHIQDSADISGMHRNTASKYIKKGKLPSELKKKTAKIEVPSVFPEGHWSEVVSLLTASPELQATAIYDYLQEKYPDYYTGKELRSLQRQIRQWRIKDSQESEVMFYQNYKPGERSQSDFVHMNYLGITIKGEHLNHLLFHFILPYSGWEYVLVCTGGESFENLSRGYERALWVLGGVPKIHRTDNLSAAVTLTKDGSYFTNNWLQLMRHYGVTPTSNNPGKSNENGKVERSNGLFKRSLENQLALRGSKDFNSIDDYQDFIEKIVEKRNIQRKVRVLEERPELIELPDGKWYSATKYPVKVHPDSTIRVEGAVYSVPSRTIGYTLSAYVYPDKVELMFGDIDIAIMDRIKKGEAKIDFKHIIHSLRKKPGAFENYKYKEHMYPNISFRKTYDMLRNRYTNESANKYYIELLYLAKMYSVPEVTAALEKLLKNKVVPKSHLVTPHLIQEVKVPDVHVDIPDLEEYNQLLEVQK
jgi:transposase